jgi:dihydroflavonol-4-reductase
VLVTGAGGFVGGHVARSLAEAGHPVRALARRPPEVRAGDPPMDWRLGDLRDRDFLAAAVAGVRGVIHCAGWVSLGPDPRGDARVLNVEATRTLLELAEAAGAERFVFTSTLHTLAAGSPDAPADEDAPWNLHRVDSPYARTKREAERLVLDRDGSPTARLVLCPGMVLGPRDPKPTSTAVVLAMARRRLALVPPGGIPIVDARVLARAHRAALTCGEPGRRYAVAGPYLGYPDLARLVGRLTGRPRWVVELPRGAEGPLSASLALARAVAPPLRQLASPAVLAGAFLPLHVSGSRADLAFSLRHPAPEVTLADTLDDAPRPGRSRSQGTTWPTVRRDRTGPAHGSGV